MYRLYFVSKSSKFLISEHKTKAEAEERKISVYLHTQEYDFENLIIEEPVQTGDMDAD